MNALNDNHRARELGEVLLILRRRFRRGEWMELLKKLSNAFDRPLSQPTAWRLMQNAKKRAVNPKGRKR